MHNQAEQDMKLGATLLDAKAPDWLEKIDLDKLNVATHSFCVLAQVFGSYTEGLRKLGLTDEEAKNHGFQTRHERTPQEHALYREQVNAAWRWEVIRRTGATQHHAVS
jgi:hypothetical protein